MKVAVLAGVFSSSDDNRIRKISGGMMTTIAGKGACCQASTAGVPASSVTMYAIFGIAADSAGKPVLSTEPPAVPQLL